MQPISRFWILLIAVNLNAIGYSFTDLYMPSLPAIREYFGTTNVYTQFSVTVYLICVGASQIIYGPLSDKYGRRVVILSGLFVSMFGSAIILSSNSIYMFLLGRMIQGMGLGVSMSLSRAVLADLYSGAMLAKTISTMNIISPLVLDFSPVLGGYLQDWFGWHANFVFLLCQSVLLFSLIFLRLPETNLNINKDVPYKELIKIYMKLISSKYFMGYTLVYSLTLSAIFAYSVVAPFILQEIVGLTASEFGLTAIVIGVTLILGGITNTLLVKYFELDTLIQAGTIIMFLSALAMLGTAISGNLSTFSFVGIFAVNLFGATMIYANSYSMALLTCKGIVGIGSSLFTFFQITTSGIACSIMAFTSESTHMPLAIYLTFGAFLAFVMLQMAKRAST